MALDTTFARRLDSRGAARGPNGADYKIVAYTGLDGRETPAFERVRDGVRETIVGYRGERFCSRDGVVCFCDQDTRI